MTHEAGHCISSYQFGATDNRLFLGCSTTKEDSLISGQMGPNFSIDICKSFFYRFFAQKGFCSSSWKPLDSSLPERLKSAWITMSGSVYGFFASYLLALLLYWVAYRKSEPYSFKALWLFPFRLYKFVGQLNFTGKGRTWLIWTVCFAYVLHVDRLFYGFIPSSIIPFFPPIVSIWGDGTVLWWKFTQRPIVLEVFSWFGWIIQIIFSGLIIRKAVKSIRNPIDIGS